VRRQTVRTRAQTARELGESEAGLFDAHLMLLDDTELLDDVGRRIDAGSMAPHAWSDVLDVTESGLDRLPDPYLRARAADVRAVQDQVLQAMSDRPAGFELRDGVLVAADLTPAEAATLDTPYAVPLVKQAVRELDVPAYQVLAGEALAQMSAVEVRALVAGRIPSSM
jgi:multiphosphoryl transfer protein